MTSMDVYHEISVRDNFYLDSCKKCLTSGKSAAEMVSEMCFNPSYSHSKTETMLSIDVVDVWPASPPPTLTTLSLGSDKYNWVRQDLRFTKYSRAKQSILW